jgi:hypothetical protein
MDLNPKPTKAHPSGDNRFKLLDRAITKHHGRGDALIEILHVAQEIFGFLESDLLVYIAHGLKRPLGPLYQSIPSHTYLIRIPATTKEFSEHFSSRTSEKIVETIEIVDGLLTDR